MPYRVIVNRTSAHPRGEGALAEPTSGTPYVTVPGNTGTLYETPEDAADALREFLAQWPDRVDEFRRIEEYEDPEEKREEEIEATRVQLLDALHDAQAFAAEFAELVAEARGQGQDAEEASRARFMLLDAEQAIDNVTGAPEPDWTPRLTSTG